jgi:polar amino acid transport system substrate-binding protein
VKIFSLLLLGVTQLSFADTVSFRADVWCPYNCDPKDKNPGYITEVIDSVLLKKGHKMDYQILAWNRALLEVTDGKYNAVIGASETDIKGGINTESFGSSKSCFFVKKESAFKFGGVSTLNGKKVGIIKDYKYGDEIDKDIASRAAGYDISFGDDALTLNIRKLDAGRVDVVLEDDAVFNYTAMKEKMSGKFVSGGCLEANLIFVQFGPKNPKNAEYAKAISEGLNELRASGELKKILDKYNLKDWK